MTSKWKLRVCGKNCVVGEEKMKIIWTLPYYCRIISIRVHAVAATTMVEYLGGYLGYATRNPKRYQTTTPAFAVSLLSLFLHGIQGVTH